MPDLRPCLSVCVCSQSELHTPGLRRPDLAFSRLGWRVGSAALSARQVRVRRSARVLDASFPSIGAMGREQAWRDAVAKHPYLSYIEIPPLGPVRLGVLPQARDWHHVAQLHFDETIRSSD